MLFKNYAHVKYNKTPYLPKLGTTKSVVTLSFEHVPVFDGRNTLAVDTDDNLDGEGDVSKVRVPRLESLGNRLFEDAEDFIFAEARFRESPFCLSRISSGSSKKFDVKASSDASKH